MSKNEFKAINMIARKMNWQNKPVECVIEAVNQMIRNDQALGLDCCGECDDYENTLLSIATWNIDQIVSCLYCWDYTTHTNYWHFLNETGMSGMEFHVLMTTYDQYQQALAEGYDLEEMAMYDAYCDKWENSYC